jgi:hypothetical protein
MTKSINLAVILFITLAFSCKEEPTKPQTETNLTLEVLDKSCTEVWIDIKANDQANKLGSVYLNDEFRTQFYLKDTLVYLDELLPNKTYTIKLTNQDGIGTQTEFTTMDTTSHNFTWETFEFGGGSSSILSDVAIINENDIWAVGEIYTKDTYTYDSNGVWQQPYNAVHWNGSKWELKRMLRVGVNNVSKINTVYAFGENDVWFDGLLKWNGEELTLHSNNFPLSSNGTGWRINSMWGESSNNFYVVGNGGNIAHYNGSSWSKIVSGTNLDIQDIYGSLNPKTNNYEIIAIASNIMTADGRTVMKIKNNEVEQLSTNGLANYFSSIWFVPNRIYYIAGAGIHKKHDIEMESNWYKYPYGFINQYYTHSIYGNDINDIFAVGSFGEAIHFNGASWKKYREIQLTNYDLKSVKMKNNLIVIAADGGGKAVIIISNN